MGTTGIRSTKMLLMKPFSVYAPSRPGLRCMSRMGGRSNHGKNTDNNPPADKRQPAEDAAGCWMPHHRSGIYFPKGQEWVMNDVPSDAASFECTYWLRSVDGVDHHKADNDNIMDNYQLKP